MEDKKEKTTKGGARWQEVVIGGVTGIALGAAPILTMLYANHLKFSIIDDKWINRDRFVMSAGHGSALLYAVLYAAGFNVTLDDLKSASSIKQLSDIVIGLERNSQDSNKTKANTTILRVLKNRDFGVKGPAAAVVYDTETTRLQEISLEEFEDDDE